MKNEKAAENYRSSIPNKEFEFREVFEGAKQNSIC